MKNIKQIIGISTGILQQPIAHHRNTSIKKHQQTYSNHRKTYEDHRHTLKKHIQTI